MSWIDKAGVTCRKYLKTWRSLLLNPGAFAALSIEHKKADYVGPWVFFSITLPLMVSVYMTLGLASWKVFDFPIPELSVSDFMPSRIAYLWFLLWALVECFLWYVIVVHWLRLRPSVRTSTPFRRLYYELLYVQVGPISLLSQLFLIIGFVLFGITFIGIIPFLFPLLPDQMPSQLLAALFGFSSGDTQKRPLRDTSKPAIGADSGH